VARLGKHRSHGSEQLSFEFYGRTSRQPLKRQQLEQSHFELVEQQLRDSRALYCIVETNDI
jgi:hypothetical protein